MNVNLASMVENNNTDGLVYLLPDSTELVIQRTIEGIQRMIKPYESNGEAEEITKAGVIEINPAMKRHWETEITILREALRDEKKLRELLKAKQEEYEKAVDSEDIERQVPEIARSLYCFWYAETKVKKSVRHHMWQTFVQSVFFSSLLTMDK